MVGPRSSGDCGSANLIASAGAVVVLQKRWDNRGNAVFSAVAWWLAFAVVMLALPPLLRAAL